MQQLKAWNNLPDYNVKLGSVLIVAKSNDDNIAQASAQKQRAEQQNVAVQQEEKKDVVIADNEQSQNTKDNSASYISNQSQQQNNVQTLLLTPPSDGFFTNQFVKKKARDMQHVSGISKTFKTTAGWNDGKYYILINNITPGTIVKITADNGNTVYAKVLWNLGDMKENNGIDFRISDAAASALSITNPTFNLDVAY